jgi:prohibitin 1
LEKNSQLQLNKKLLVNVYFDAAQQEAERAKFVVERAEQEKLASIIRAEGESIAAKLLSDAYKQYGNAHLDLRKIETSKEIAEKLSSNPNVTWLPTHNGSNILLNVAK